MCIGDLLYTNVLNKHELIEIKCLLISHSQIVMEDPASEDLFVIKKLDILKNVMTTNVNTLSLYDQNTSQAKH